jgi:hypothetical protein
VFRWIVVLEQSAKNRPSSAFFSLGSEAGPPASVEAMLLTRVSCCDSHEFILLPQRLQSDLKNSATASSITPGMSRPFP